MQIITDTVTTLVNTFLQFTWRDALEILAFSYIIHKFLWWLNQDTQKNLVLYFYGYCFITFSAHTLQLTILSQTLLVLSPVILCVFIILHQQSLQKNFVSLQKVTPTLQTSDHWIDELIRASLYAMNKSKNLIWVIERKNSLEASLSASCLFYADLKKDLIDLLLETQTTTDTILWTNQTGKLIAINAQWKIKPTDLWVSPQAQQLPEWQQHALLISSKTDAIIIHCCSIERLFTVIVQEKSVERVSAHQTSLLLKRILIQTSSFQEGISYASQPSQTPTQQRHT